MRSIVGMLLIIAGIFEGGCGGHAREDPTPAGPPHEGMGLYDLRIERVSDDCDPPMSSGEIGPAVVVVALEQGRAGGANVPLGDKPVPATSPRSGAGRADISFGRTLTDDTVLAAPGCSAHEHFELSTVNATSQSIDVEYTWAPTALSNCSSDSGEPAHDCTSDRIFHFEWLHACDGNLLSTCQ